MEGNRRQGRRQSEMKRYGEEIDIAKRRKWAAQECGFEQGPKDKGGPSVMATQKNLDVAYDSR